MLTTRGPQFLLQEGGRFGFCEAPVFSAQFSHLAFGPQGGERQREVASRWPSVGIC
jgi:hypothetical protein